MLLNVFRGLWAVALLPLLVVNVGAQDGQFSDLFGPQPIPARDLFVEDSIVDVVISPNGQHIAVAERETGRSEVKIFSAETRELLGRIPLEGYRASSLEWASDRRVLITLRQWRKIKLGGNQYTTVRGNPSQVLSVDLAGGSMLVLFANAVGFGDIRGYGGIENRLPEEENQILIQGIEKGAVHLFKVNVNNGALKRVAKGGPNTEDWISDLQGNPMLRIDGGGTTKYAGWRPLTVLYAPDSDGSWKKIRSYSRTRDDEQREFVPVGRTTDSDSYAVVSFSNNDEWSTLKRYELATNEFSATIGAIEGIDVSSAILDPRDQSVIGVEGWRNERVLKFFDAALQKRWNRIEELLGDQRNARLWSASDDLSRIVVVATGPTSAGYYSLYDAETDTLTSLFPRSARLSSRNLGKAEVMQYRTRDGLGLEAYVTHPHGVASDEAAPLVVMIHGGPHARDRFDYNPRVQFLTSRGYRVMQPYFRGSIGRGRTFMEAGYGEWGLTMQDDITDAFLALKQRGLADADTTCIAGASYGGYAALFAQIKTPDLFSCSVAVAAVTDLNRQLRYDMEIFLRGTTTRKSVEATLATDSGTLSLADRSPAKQISKITKPVLIAHGENDWRVPWRIAKDFWTRMKGSETRSASIIFKYENHAGWSDRAEILYHQCLEDFLAVNIGGKVAGDHTPTWDTLRCPGRMNE